MRVLVAGGAGYIGSHTVKALAEAGHEPVVADNLEKGHDWAVRWGAFEFCQLGEPAAIDAVFQKHAIDAVIHFAAYIEVGESMRDPGKYFRNNVGCTLNLLEGMRRAGVRHIVFSSTAAVYGTPEQTPIPETHPKRPVNAYGETKLMVEHMLDWYGVCHGFAAAKLRYFNAAGADAQARIGEAHDPESHLIPLVLAAAYGHRPSISVFGSDYPTPDGTAVRDYIHVDDLAQAHLRALERIRATEATCEYNLGTGRGASVREVIAMVEQVTGRGVPVVEAPRRAGDPAELVADPRKARQELGWSAVSSELSNIVETAGRWYRAHFGE
ncbi:MAG: UDP-glucose 4-epimerase GalE [Bryobacterales bacterium]|nr:UDP-glucose 4-epimerase GalE [Bryobacterales bacterium]